MKYLVLLLMFFMVSNVKAETVKDTYLLFSYNDKLKMLDMCRLGNFGDRDSDATDKQLYEIKGDICSYAWLFLHEQEQKEYNLDKRIWLSIEKNQMVVKAANFYYLGNINTNSANTIKQSIHDMYNTECLKNSKKDFLSVFFCEIYLTYKGLDIGKIR